LLRSGGLFRHDQVADREVDQRDRDVADDDPAEDHHTKLAGSHAVWRPRH
jgi:hypothetical protein